MAYDIAEAFRRVEEELISSMIRNLKRHRAEETKEGFLWTQWQVEQLAALEEYHRRNRKKFSSEFSQIHKVVGNLINAAREEGNMHQEEEILKAIRDGAKLHKNPDTRMNARFFRMNDRKMNALIKATQDDFREGERAILRQADDQYRRVIFDAQVCANSGAATYEKAVDMATKDFLRAGIQCVEYSNGARHTLSDYADMAIRTAQKRAYLTGEGEKRQEWGTALVIMNKRTDACPKCLPFSGKVMIDDVWSGGKPDGKHMLISTAMERGLYHPRCRDSHTTYFPGISTAPDKGWTKEELEALEKDEKKRERLIYAENQAEKYDRLAENSLDPENRQSARHHANQWKEQAAPFTPAKTIEEAQAYAQNFCQKSFMDRTFKGEVSFKGISLEHANAINRSLTEVYNRFPDLDKLSGIKAVAPGSAQGKKAFKSGADALFSYSPVEHGIFINKDILKSPKALDEYMKRSEDAYNLVMNNMDKLSGRQRELAERYAEAGRELVSGDTVEGLFAHELGHHVQWTMLDPKTTNSLTSRMSQYAPHLSGYATSSNSEYLAESFAAYMKGERNLLDPEYVAFLNKKIRHDTMGNTINEADIIDGMRRTAKNLLSDQKIVSYSELSENIRKPFTEGLINADPLVKGVLRKNRSAVDYIESMGHSYYKPGIPGTIMISKSAPPGSLAHEIFHFIDQKKGISAVLKQPLLQDYNNLMKISQGNVKGYLENKYPSAFMVDPRSKRLILRDEYRAISDILNGLSGGTIRYGRGHSKTYWQQNGSLEKEAWAQFGRVYFDNLTGVRKMLTEIFPEFEKNAIIKIKELV